MEIIQGAYYVIIPILSVAASAIGAYVGVIKAIAALRVEITKEFAKHGEEIARHGERIEDLCRDHETLEERFNRHVETRRAHAG